MDHEFRCIEFFSGIGGMVFISNPKHYALRATGIDFKVVASYDVNLNANLCYTHNFGTSPNSRSIDVLTVNEVERLKANLWLMSPPCQPFTRGGKNLDSDDNRSKALLNLINILENLKNKPEYILLENVVNFEVSECRNLLCDTLSRFGYQVREYILTPLELGIPNNRERYFLTAKRQKTISERMPLVRSLRLKIPYRQTEISEYLQDDCSEFLVPENYLQSLHEYKYDVVNPNSKSSATFTKAYGGKHMKGTGSLLQTKEFDSEFSSSSIPDLIRIGVRFFTPSEVARLHCFPSDFHFPSELTSKQKYMLLGNSLNVSVVSMLLKRLLIPANGQ